MGEPIPPTETLSGEELAKSWESEHTTKPLGGKIAMVLLLALLLTLGVSAYIYQERVLEELQGMRAYLAGAKPATTTDAVAPVPPPPPPPTVSMSSSNTSAVKPTEALSPGNEELVPASPDPVPSPDPTPTDTKVKTEPAPALPEPPKTPVTQPEKELVKPKTAPSKSVKEPTKTADKSSQADSSAWVEALDPNVWVMQHGAFESLAEARNFQATSLGYQSGQVLFTQRKGSKPYYILITGPYNDREQAQALMKQNPPLAKAWVRSAKSIKAQFQD